VSASNVLDWNATVGQCFAVCAMVGYKVSGRRWFDWGTKRHKQEAERRSETQAVTGNGNHWRSTGTYWSSQQKRISAPVRSLLPPPVGFVYTSVCPKLLVESCATLSAQKWHYCESELPILETSVFFWHQFLITYMSETVQWILSKFAMFGPIKE